MSWKAGEGGTMIMSSHSMAAILGAHSLVGESDRISVGFHNPE
jgi:hypothetical protein